ncbi:MAG: T9SS type A sorting domain-containing protein [Bacteroidia bacterium]|nr:T9SS type A sorting domain-containing protein [Bacteroidia bacterium]
MKKYLFVLIIFCQTEFAYTQAYNPLIEDNKYWDVLHFCGFLTNPICGYCDDEGRYFLNGDTIINGKEYKKIYVSGFIKNNTVPDPYFCPPYLVDTVSFFTHRFIREDTLEKKVYYFDEEIYSNYSACIVDGEVLLYDFNYEQGDTLKIITASYDCEFHCIVDTVKYELINGINRKVFYFYGDGGYNKMIEGIGGSYEGGGLFQIILMGIGWSYNLVCVRKDETVYLGEDCADYITNFQYNNFRFDEPVIYPNPTNQYFFIDNVLNDEIRVYNIIGNIVLTINVLKNNTKIDISNLSKGTYFIRTANTYKKIIKL